MMKKFGVIFLILTVSALFHNGLLAQRLNVISFEQALQDLYASTHVRCDINGNPCAVLKVQIPGLDNIKFEGWVLNQSYTPGEYIVYVPAGTKKIIIKHPNFLPLEYMFPEKIEGKSTYKMALQVPSDNTGKVLVNVKTNSLNATMRLDGQVYQTENAQFVVVAQNGKHSVKIESTDKDLNPYDGEINVDGDAFQEFVCNMTSDVQYDVRFVTEKGVSIYLDGEKVDKIKNNTLIMTAGVHDIEMRIEKDGTAEWYRQAKVEVNSSTEVVDLSLSGFLTFAYPKDAKFKIKPISESALKPAESTVTTGQEVRLLGDYEVTVSKKGYASRSVKLSITERERLDAYKITLTSKADEYEQNYKYDKAFLVYSKMSDDNDEYALYKMGEYFYSGKGNVKVNKAQAIGCWKRAADAGSIEAMKKLQSQEISEREKVYYLEKAAKLGDIEAMNLLGEYYYGTHNYVSAMECFLNVQKDKPSVNFYIGEMYNNGLGVEKNVQTAKSYYEIGSCTDDERCDERLADYLYNQNKIDEACEAYLKLSRPTEMTKIKLAKWYNRKEDYANAAKWLVGVNTDNISSFDDVSSLYREVANRLYKDDKSLACNLFEILVAHTNVDDNGIYYRLGLFYENNNSVKSFQYYESGAECENRMYETDKSSLSQTSCMCRLGYCYEVGLGTNQNYYLAVQYYENAIRNGYKKAYRFLGSMYAGGYGVEKNYDTAVRLWKLGAESGDKSAIRKLVKYYKYVHNEAQARKWEAKLAQ